MADEETTTEPRYQFVGNEGAHVIGIPARHLYKEDIDSFTDEQKEILKGHLKSDQPIYVRIKVEKEVKEGKKSDG